MLTEHVDTDSLSRLVADSGADLVVLSRALEIIRELHLSGRLLVELRRVPDSEWLEISDASADQTIGVRSADHTVRWLGEPTRVSPDTLAWPLPASQQRTVLWLEVANSSRVARVEMADPAWAILADHDWRWDATETTAEAALWVADFLDVIAQVLTGAPPLERESTRSPIERRMLARHALVAIQRSVITPA